MMRAFVPVLCAALGAVILAPSPKAWAEAVEPGFRPDEAILACNARSMHDIGNQGGRDIRALRRFEAEPMDRTMWHVSGSYAAEFDGETRSIAVDCDVTLEGVQVFTMEVLDDPDG